MLRCQISKRRNTFCKYVWRFFTEIATEILDNGGQVYGVGYSDGMDVLHMRIDNAADLKILQKSKYVQSDMRNVYANIKKDIESGSLVLFVGCPCQVAAIYSFLGKTMLTFTPLNSYVVGLTPTCISCVDKRIRGCLKR